MAKTPLSPLSSILPAKGEAARPEAAPAKAPGEPASQEKAPRDGLTIRILASDNRRLRKAVFMENRSKQSLLDQAISEFLDRTGY